MSKIIDDEDGIDDNPVDDDEQDYIERFSDNDDEDIPEDE